MSPSGNSSPCLFGPAVSPCGNIRPREHNASPNPRFLASGPPHSLAETRKKPPSLHPKRSPTPTVPTRREPRWAFGSAISPSGNTILPHFGPVVSPSGTPGLGSTTRVQTHSFSRRDLFALWRKIARNYSYCARRGRGSEVFLIDERRNSSEQLPEYRSAD